ncbi:MAG: nucleoside hydrolase [Pseudomonadota bacterium]
MLAILDCDPGNGIAGADIDDGLALGLLLLHDAVELLAVTVVAGNTDVVDGVRSGLHMLELAEVDTPLYQGAGRPLVEDPDPWRVALTTGGGRTKAAALWSDIASPMPKRRRSHGTAADEICKLVRAYPHEVTIFATGPLTNIALAIEQDAELPQLVKQIVVMGGCFGVPEMLQELNFCFDPEAAQAVFASGAPLVLTPFDTTRKTLFTLKENDRLSRSDNPLVKWLSETTEPWIRYMMTRGGSGCSLHDPFTVAVALDSSFTTCKEVCVGVETTGKLTRGRAVSWNNKDKAVRVGLDLPEPGPVTVISDVDNDRFIRFLMDTYLDS